MDFEKTKKLRVVPMSDLHGYLPKPEDVPECDVVCVCGDFVPLEYQNDDVASISWFCLEFIPWTDSLNCKKVILCAGNHDFFMEHIMLGPVREDGTRKCRTAAEVLKKLLPGNNKGKHKLIYLRDSSVTVDGVKFYGTPWTTELPGWAFSCTEEDFKGHLKEMPKKIDVLLTHMPPAIDSVGIVLQQSHVYGRDFSSKVLANEILKRDIQYVFCGHVHSGSHVATLYDSFADRNTKECRHHWITNVSVKDEDYKVQTFYFSVFEV